ncbi:MAG: DUF3093 domain-containing protein [Streptosporangiaceae bacterium]
MREYEERLSVPLWWWPVAAACVSVLGAEVHAGLGVVGAVATYTVLGVIVIAGLLAYGRVRVQVRGGELRAGSARLPLTAMGDTLALGPADARSLLGPHADARAHVVHRPYVATAVYVEVSERATNTTPYWLVSTRHPERLVATLSSSATTPRGTIDGGGSEREGSEFDAEG